MRARDCKFCKVVDAIKGSCSVLHCCPCDQFFIDSESYQKHDSLKHKGEVSSLPSAPFTCLDCQKDFYDEPLFQSHLARHGVARRVAEHAARHGIEPSQPEKRIIFCPHCNRDFTSVWNRDRHILFCPNLYRCLDSNCPKRFRSLTGLVSHLESGSCEGGYTRDKINFFVCERDRIGQITLPGALDTVKESRKITAASETNGFDLEDKLAMLSITSSSSGLLTPDSDDSEIEFEIPRNGRILEIEEILSAASEDSDLTPTSLASPALLSELVPSRDEDIPPARHKCEICHKTFLSKTSLWQHLESLIHGDLETPTQVTIKEFKTCRICHREFASGVGLRQHLESPTHSPNLYHCELPFLQRDPESVQSHGTRREFKTLSGLVAHIEAGACGGDATLDTAITMLARLASEFGFPEMAKVAKSIGGKFASLEEISRTTARPVLITDKESEQKIR